MDKVSHYCTQLGPPNPLEECMSQFLDTKVASQMCYMKHFDDKFTKSTTFRNHNLVHSIRIAAINRKYP